jgi:ABC-type uncharacterized transport system ATPase subunit
MSETPPTLLDVRGLACRFGGLQAVADLDFAVRAGEIKAIIGPNGAGKTTLFNMISGVIAPSAGQILLSGEPIDRLPAFQRARRGLGRTFQNLQIFREMTVLENVMVGCHTRSHCGTAQAILAHVRRAIGGTCDPRPIAGAFGKSWVVRTRRRAGRKFELRRQQASGDRAGTGGFAKAASAR